MLLAIHLIGNAFFLVAFTASLGSLAIGSSGFEWHKKALLASSGLQIGSGVFLALSGGSGLGRACVSGIALMAVTLPLYVALGNKAAIKKTR
jgi:hypothetical protein